MESSEDAFAIARDATILANLAKVFYEANGGYVESPPVGVTIFISGAQLSTSDIGLLIDAFRDQVPLALPTVKRFLFVVANRSVAPSLIAENVAFITLDELRAFTHKIVIVHSLAESSDRAVLLNRAKARWVDRNVTSGVAYIIDAHPLSDLTYDELHRVTAEFTTGQEWDNNAARYTSGQFQAFVRNYTQVRLPHIAITSLVMSPMSRVDQIAVVAAAPDVDQEYVRQFAQVQPLVTEWPELRLGGSAETGYGVYATRDIARSDTVANYAGVLLTVSDFIETYRNRRAAPFVFPIDSQLASVDVGGADAFLSTPMLASQEPTPTVAFYMDCQDVWSSPARHIVDCIGPDRLYESRASLAENLPDCNAQLRFENDQLLAVAIRDIKAGEEIKLVYGDDYWQLIAREYQASRSPTQVDLDARQTPSDLYRSALLQFHRVSAQQLLATDALSRTTTLLPSPSSTVNINTDILDAEFAHMLAEHAPDDYTSLLLSPMPTYAEDEEEPRDPELTTTTTTTVASSNNPSYRRTLVEESTSNSNSAQIYKTHSQLARLMTLINVFPEAKPIYSQALEQMSGEKYRARKTSHTAVPAEELREGTQKTMEAFEAALAEDGYFMMHCKDWDDGVLFDAGQTLEAALTGATYTRKTAVEKAERARGLPDKYPAADIPTKKTRKPTAPYDFKVSLRSLLESLSPPLVQPEGTGTYKEWFFKELERKGLPQKDRETEPTLDVIIRYFVDGQRNMSKLLARSRLKGQLGPVIIAHPKDAVDIEDTNDDNRPYNVIRLYDDINDMQKMLTYARFIFVTLDMTMRALVEHYKDRLEAAEFSMARRLSGDAHRALRYINAEMTIRPGRMFWTNRIMPTRRGNKEIVDEAQWYKTLTNAPNNLQTLDRLLRETFNSNLRRWIRVFKLLLTAMDANVLTDYLATDAADTFRQLMLVGESEIESAFSEAKPRRRPRRQTETEELEKMQRRLLSLSRASYPKLDQYNPNLGAVSRSLVSNADRLKTDEGARQQFAQAIRDMSRHRFKPEKGPRGVRVGFKTRLTVQLRDYSPSGSLATEYPERSLVLLVYLPSSMSLNSYWLEQYPIRPNNNSEPLSVDIDSTILSLVDTTNAFVGFHLMAKTSARSDRGTSLAYERLVPLADGRLYVRDMKEGKKPLRVALVDTAYPNGHHDQRATLLVSVTSLEIGPAFRLLRPYVHRVDQSSSLFSGATLKRLLFSSASRHNDNTSLTIEDKYAYEQEVMREIVSRYFECYKSTMPYRPELFNIHVPRWPSSSGWVMSSLFFMALPYDYASLASSVLYAMMTVQLDMSEREFPGGEAEWVSVVERQFTNEGGQIGPRFEQAVRTLAQALTLFANLCEYKTDYKLGGEVCERFIEISLTMMGDCEDLAKYAAMLAYALFSVDLHTIGDSLRKTKPLEYWMIRCLQIYVPFGVEGAVTLPSQSRNEIEPTDETVCHVYAMLIPRGYFIQRCTLLNGVVPQYVESVQGPIRAWESHLNVMTLEGTTFANPYQRPMDTIDPGYSTYISRTKEIRKHMERRFRALGGIGVDVHPQHQTVDDPTAYEHMSDFYREPISLWSGVLLLWGVANVTDMTLMCASGIRYGVPYKLLVYKSDQISIRPTFVFSDSELHTCYDIVKRTVPFRFCMDKREQDPTLYRKTQLRHWDTLREKYPTHTTDYILYKTNHISKMTDTDDIYDSLETILSQGLYGIVGFDYGYFADMPQDLQLFYVKLYYRAK